MGILEKISEIEKEIARTQKNKGEAGPAGLLRSGRRAGAVGAGRDQARTSGPSGAPQLSEQRPTWIGRVGVRTRVSWRLGLGSWRSVH